MPTPPWTYRDTASAGNRGAGFKYSLMTQNEIANLSVQEIADDDCILFMWVTMPKLDECFEIIKKWGFQYKTVAFTWVKRNKKSSSYFMGMGRWTRANAELCLIATKGKPKRSSASVYSVVDTPIEKHSQKPNEVRDRIVKLMGDIPRVELFARTKTEGWDIWGDEVISDIVLK